MTSHALHNDNDNDNHSVCSGASNDSHARETDQGDAAAGGGETTLAVRETKSVGRLKRAVWIVLIASAIGVALTTYFYLSRLQEEHFHRQFNDEAHKVLEAVGQSLDKTLGLLDSIAVAYVSHAQANNDTWPFVTLPNYALKMAKVLPLSDAFVLSMVPIVTPKQRGDWEAYSVAHDDCVDESMAIQASWGKYNGPITYHGLPNRKVHGDDGDIAPNVR
jgi:hypothetical protein